MSAFVCNEKHFLALAVWATRPTGGGARAHASYLRHFGGSDCTGMDQEDVANYFADVLMRENVRSVRARYQDMVVAAPFIPSARPDQCAGLTPLHILKMCDCLEYQSCETDDYHTTTAWHLLQAIRRAAIRELPGYDEAPWEYHGQVNPGSHGADA